MMLRQGIIQIAKVKVRNAKDRARLMVNGYSIVVASCVAQVVLLYPQDPWPDAYYRKYIAMDDMKAELRNFISYHQQNWPNIKTHLHLHPSK